MQLVAHSARTSKVADSSSTVHHGSGSSSNSSRDYNDLTTASGEVTPAVDRQTTMHRCWQPLLIAYGSEDGGQESISSGREVVRAGPAALSLWAIDAHGKHIGVLSDPSCFLQLRFSFHANSVFCCSWVPYALTQAAQGLHAGKGSHCSCIVGVASAWLQLQESCLILGKGLHVINAVASLWGNHNKIILLFPA